MTKKQRQEFIDECVKQAEEDGAQPRDLPWVVERAASAYDLVEKYGFKVTRK